jgi:type I restriction enzyme, S subunit
MNEQSRIAELLFLIDKAIVQVHALIGKQQRIHTGLVQQLFSRGIDSAGRIRRDEPSLYKLSVIGRIPAEWKISSLGSLASFITSGSRGWARYYSHDGPLFLRIGNLTREHINLRLDDVVRVELPTSAEGQRTSVKSNDLVISITADLGIIGVIPSDLGEAYVNQHIALVRVSGSDVCQRFIGWFLSSRYGQNQFEKMNESGAKSGLNLPAIAKLQIAMPPVREQIAIMKILDSSIQVVERFRQEHSKLSALRTGLMQDLLTGKKRVTALIDQEPRREKVYA